MSFTLSWQGCKQQARLVWDRIAFSRLTIFYFIFSLLHFAIQLSLQIRAFTINANAASFLGDLLVKGNALSPELPLMRQDSVILCTWLPSNLNDEHQSCHTVWSPEAIDPDSQRLQDPATPFSSIAVPSSAPTILVPVATPSATITLLTPSRAGTLSRQTSTVIEFVTAAGPVPPRPTASGDDDDDDDDGNDDDDDDERKPVPSAVGLRSTVYKRDLTINGPEGELVLSDVCLRTLNWPATQLHNTKREDIVFIAFQFWVLGMSVVALLNESIPHVLASLLTHVLVTAWAAFQITHTHNFRTSFNRIVSNGACNGLSLPDYWENRSRAEIPSLSLHAIALVVSAFLTWKLVKLYGWQTFKRVGASRQINRLYKIVLVLSITIQLALFFMFATVALWIDQLFNSVIGDLATFATLYKATSFATIVLLVPWLMMGWFSVRRELRLTMFFFLVLSILYLAGWGVMFFSTTFRWTFETWRFFAVMACASVFLTCMSFILGVVCRFNFGKGLLRYLNNSRDSVVEDDNDTSSIWDEKKDIENFIVPSFNSPVPTFSASYKTESFYSPDPKPHQDPPHYTRGAGSYESNSPIASPPPAVTRNLTDIPQVKRSDSNSSDRSHASIVRHLEETQHYRNNSQASKGSSKRWVIE